MGITWGGERVDDLIFSRRFSGRFVQRRGGPLDDAEFSTSAFLISSSIIHLVMMTCSRGIAQKMLEFGQRRHLGRQAMYCSVLLSTPVRAHTVLNGLK